MALGVNSVIEEIKDIIECCICNEVFTDPRTLPCMHTFCLGCLQKIDLQSSKKAGQTFPCPVCRKEFAVPAAGWTSIQKNFFMKRLVEMTWLSKTGKPPSPSQEVNKEAVPDHLKVNGGVNSCDGASNPEANRDRKIVFETSQLTEKEDDLIRDSVDLRKLDLQRQNFLRDVDTTEKAIVTRQKELQDAVAMHAKFLCEQLILIKENGLKELACQKQKLEAKISKERDANSTRPKTELRRTKSSGPWHKKGDLQRSAIDRYRSAIGLCSLEGELDGQKGELRDKKGKKDTMCQFNPGNADSQQEEQSQSEQHIMSPGKVSFKISDIQDFLTSKNILGQIKVVNSTEVHHLIRLKIPSYIVCGLTKVDNHIYVLCQSPNTIRCYEDNDPYTLRREVKIKQVKRPWDLATRSDFNCLYVTDREKNCVWKVKMNDRRVTRWLSGIANPWTISASRSTGHILMVRSGQPSSLELYGPGANLIRCVHLSIDIENPLHAVETSRGHFIVSHKWRVSRSWGVSELTRDGQAVHRFCPKGKAQELNNPSNLSLDANDRVFVVDFYNHRVVLLESDLRWGQTLLREDTDGTHAPLKLCYDRNKKQLVVGHDRLGGAVDVYRLL